MEVAGDIAPESALRMSRAVVWGAPLRLLVLALDALLRRVQGIYEFSQKPDCIVRIARRHSRTSRTLSDGTVVRPGDLIIELHFWNEHIPRIGGAGPDLAWGLAFYRRMRGTLVELARHVSTSPDLSTAVAFYAVLTVPLAAEGPQYARLLRSLGFDFNSPPPLRGRWQRLRNCLELGYNGLLVWAFQPNSLRDRQFLGAFRAELWISRTALLARYGKSLVGHTVHSRGGET